ncbi:hypothetical protein F4778DRAFT_696576 [Xylariomycetidae sp. FL2044]|nr:hypothetical protein F4778DRAFT_696576 [Xylariomycetidae sp. FL2044]
MVSFWPWKGESSSPASFEKTLSILSAKITTTQTQLDRVRNSSRRIRVLWTLYLAFAYLVYAIVLVLVVGTKNLGSWEWTGLAGGPVLIYLIRTLTNAYFSYRIDVYESRLKDQQSERAKTIQKLKDATRYDSTQELLKKYGGGSGGGGRKEDGATTDDGSDNDQVKQGQGPAKKGRQSLSPHTHVGRTGLPPPPTANIQRPTSSSGPHGSSRQFQGPSKPLSQIQSPQSTTAEFAPNAEDFSPAPSQYETYSGPPHWYDRVLDLMLGEDETAPKNRIVLICHKCRLVNGQAPPGVKTLSELGTWRCMACNAKNGEMDEGKKIMQEVLGDRKANRGTDEEKDSEGSSDIVKVDRVDEEGTPTIEEPTPRRRANNKKSQMVP